MPKKYMAHQSSVAMNAVTTMNKNQCVDVIRAGDANDMQMMPKTCNWYEILFFEEKCVFCFSHLFEYYE